MCEVSVFCLTYNHEKYVSRAIESFLAQETTFAYEIIIHDDASTDSTVDILKYYKKKYPDKLKLIIEKNNQYSKGGIFDIRNQMLKKMKGKYIAFCEGDDFWIDNQKLQKQWEAMELHEECDMCACGGLTFSEDGIKAISQIRPRFSTGILEIQEVILGGGQYIVSAGMFFRRNVWKKPMDFQKIIAIDYATQIRGALRGGIWYIDEKMAAYRRNANGSWSERVLKNKDNLRKQWVKEIELLEVLDEDTGYIYHDSIVERLKSYTSFMDQLEERKKEVVNMVTSIEGGLYLWGMGRRGEEFEEFCNLEGIILDGVCDASNEHVGEITIFNNKVLNTCDVLIKADVILASNDYVYNDLLNSDYSGVIVNLQQYMPYG